MEALAPQLSLFVPETATPLLPLVARPLRLALVLDHRQWLEWLADEWWPLSDNVLPLQLGVGSTIDTLHAEGRIPVLVWIDPDKLPRLTVPILRAGTWRQIDLSGLSTDDQEIIWPCALPLSAIDSFSTRNQLERERLLAFANGYAGLAPLTQRIDIEQWPIRPGTRNVPQPTLILPPANWDAARGAAAMAVWAVPSAGPWLSALCAALALENDGAAATTLAAPWWAEPPWQTSQPVAAATTYPIALWRAILAVLAPLRLRDGWQPKQVLDQVATKVASWCQQQANLVQLDNWVRETKEILQDRRQVDGRRGIDDPLGLTLQLLLLRPKPEQFATWRNDLLAMPPVVWWTGATLSGWLAGFRYLDAHYTGAAVTRRLLALRTWQFAQGDASIGDWPDLPAPRPSWHRDGTLVGLTWGQHALVERKENSRGKWYAADLTLEPNRQAAIGLARKFGVDCLCQIIRLKDAQLAVTGSGKLALNSQQNVLAVDGEVVLRLPADRLPIEDDLDEAKFKDWVLRGSIPEILDMPPVITVPQANAVPPVRSSAQQSDSLATKAEPRHVAAVPGLTIIEEFITPEQEAALIGLVDRAPWLNELSRRVQHYGWKYEYKSRQVSRDAYLGPLPDWAQSLAERLWQAKWVPELPDQVIVNEYVGEQNISKHVDCITCFRGPIVTISLNEAWEMIFRHPETKDKVAQQLARRSAAILNGPARDVWTHEIPRRQKEPNGLRRGRRISLTFRKVDN